MNIELSDQEVAQIVTGLCELPAKHSFDLLCRFRALIEAAREEASKKGSPDLKMVSQA
jgi:hypothetical protein